MKKILLIFILVLVPLSLAIATNTNAVYADVYDPLAKVCDSTTNNESEICKDNSSVAANPKDNPISGANGIIVRAAGIISIVTGVASIIIILIGSIKYITASGDSNAISSAKHTIMYALVGLIVTLLARGFILLVVNRIN